LLDARPELLQVLPLLKTGVAKGDTPNGSGDGNFEFSHVW
jgi:hypothetical protein